ncbi:hypothetical protein [Larkinella sp. C7]|uniref:hypothetical protein n=1 Tax=Larkinella sp. C7 TaxID=2576607 RepID=UPI00148697A0|nr:hypothetical protein [Larkinella sp. C7]
MIAAKLTIYHLAIHFNEEKLNLLGQNRGGKGGFAEMKNPAGSQQDFVERRN